MQPVNKYCFFFFVVVHFLGCAVIDGLIYAVGGACGSQHHSSVERYYAYDNRWESVAPMIMQRMGLGCVVVNRLLYAVGGFDGVNRLNQVECYNPDINVWQMVAPMQVPRSGAGKPFFILSC
jgi:hypothetical protein